MKCLTQGQTCHRDLGPGRSSVFLQNTFFSQKKKKKHAYLLVLSTKLASVFYQWLPYPLRAIQYYIYTVYNVTKCIYTFSLQSDLDLSELASLGLLEACIPILKVSHPNSKEPMSGNSSLCVLSHLVSGYLAGHQVGGRER